MFARGAELIITDILVYKFSEEVQTYIDSLGDGVDKTVVFCARMGVCWKHGNSSGNAPLLTFHIGLTRFVVAF